MTAPVRVCRACDELITDPAAAVLVGHEPSMSGPGWDVWAHPEHAAEAAEPDPDYVRIMARILVARALHAST